MTKKRLEDLLREEVGKPPDSETEALPEAAPDQLPTDAPSSEIDPLSETSAEPLSVNASEILRPKRTNSTKAELETTVTELQEALQTAHQNEGSLQQQVADLQLGLQEQQTLVQKLQENLEQANSLQAELEQAKSVILKLSETNSRVTQEISTTKESKDFRSQKLILKKLPLQSAELSSPSKKLSDADIGWVD